MSHSSSPCDSYDSDYDPSEHLALDTQPQAEREITPEREISSARIASLSPPLSTIIGVEWIQEVPDGARDAGRTAVYALNITKWDEGRGNKLNRWVCFSWVAPSLMWENFKRFDDKRKYARKMSSESIEVWLESSSNGSPHRSPPTEEKEEKDCFV
ncbi:hypothetical protein Tco_0532790 [Tanacetum coccineum]